MLRGQFTPPDADRVGVPGDGRQEWCERRLLARIHRYTIRTLRAEIEPVSSADFMRFLLDWQGVTRDPRPEGIESLAALITQLEGYEIPASAWESDVLPARIHEYDPNWLDTLCQSGRALWARLTPAKGMTAAPVRSTPITLLTRRNWILWQSLTEQPHDDMQLSHPAQALWSISRGHGASFFDDIVSGTGLLRAQAEAALAEVVAAGLVNADSYSGLRALLIPSERRRRLAARRRRIALFGLEDAGRWSLMRRGAPPAAMESVEQVATILLRRYGVVFRRVLEREAEWLPPWHALLRVYRRLEAQGTIRGGRFVAGMSGEQYALPEAVTALRAVRRREQTGDLIGLSAADPLNLTGHRDTRATRPCACRQPRAVPGRRAGRDPCRWSVRFPGGDGTRLGMGSPAGSAAQAPGSMAGTGTTGLTHSHAAVEQCGTVQLAVRRACIVRDLARSQPAAPPVHLERRLIGLSVEVEQRSPGKTRLFVERHHQLPADAPTAPSRVHEQLLNLGPMQRVRLRAKPELHTAGQHSLAPRDQQDA